MENLVWNAVERLITETEIEIDPHERIYVNCGLCKKIMIEPRQIICGCRICLECLTDYLRNGGKHCPVGATSSCRGIELSSLDDVFVDKESMRKILSVPVHCPVTGCDVESSLEDMLEHVSSCRIINGDNEVIIIKDNKGNEINMTLMERVDLIENSLTKMIQGINNSIDKLDLRLRTIETGIVKSNSRIESLTGTMSDIYKKVNEERNDDFMWKIDNYSTKKDDVSLILSDEFYTRKNGYNLKVMLLPNKEIDGRRYLSIFFKIIKGSYDDILQWPFKYDVTMSVVDQELSSRDHSLCIKYSSSEKFKYNYQKPGISNKGIFGCSKFLSISELESSSYLLKNDTLYIRCSVNKV